MLRTPRTTIALALVLTSSTLAVRAHAQQPPLTQLQFDIVGVRLVVDPPVLTVPKNIATQINTSLALPPNSGPEARTAIDTLTDGAVVEAELRGPDLTPTRIVTRAGQPIPIPPLALPGDYFLDGIRLVKDGRTILDATAPDGRLATTIPIRVISEVFVTNVTSRPLSLDEIRGRGIVIDQNNFRAVNFQVAFNIDGAPFTINLPAALPTPEFLQQRPTRAAVIEQLTAINQQLRGLATQLPPQFDRPGLNFSIAALPFFPVEEDGGIPSLDVPPITGLVVIPGNIAFLNQFFSVLLMVTNVAPDGTTLELRETQATIVLPTGLDRVLGTFDQPGDDPLRLARIEGVGVQPTVPVVQLGPDGQRNTADDIASITPQRSGEGEFLVEGLKEGSHLFDLEIQAMLYGLPSGPVRLIGLAAGAVFVRNPTFSVTLAHPRTIRSGEPYNLYATVTNTSQSAANLVSVNLDPRGISGAQLVSDESVTFETIAPGQAVTAKFSLVAQRTGEVTFSSFTGEAAAGGGIQLTTGIDERGVPLAPNAIVLPRSADNLPPALVTAAQRVLGQAFSIATAPAEALPAGVLFVKKQTVIDRGLDLAQAGERLGFGEPLARVIQDLTLDWLGNTSLDSGLDTGFDQILRTTEAGAAFLAELAAVLQTDAAGPGILPYQTAFAQTTVGRAPHVSAAVGSTPGVAAPLLTVARALGGSVGRSPNGADHSLVSGAAFDLSNTAGDARLAVVGAFEADRYTIETVATAAGMYDLGVVVPGTAPGQLIQLRYPGVLLDAGGRARLVVDLPLAGLPALLIDRNGDGQFEGQSPSQQQIIVEAPPGVVAVRQLVSAYRESPGDIRDPATYGLLVGVLFDKPVTAASAELRTNYAIESNAVIGARLQSSGRLVYLYLERPVGALVPRSLTLSGVVDARGNLLSPATTPIAMALSDGARVFGQVRTSDGRGVPSSVLRLTVSAPPFAFDVATLRTDTNGSFDFDFVPRIGNVVLTAQHPVTNEIVSLTARIRGQGEQLLLNPTFQGKGLVRGRVFAADGITPAANVQVALLPGSVSSRRGYETRTNPLGEFAFADVPVGVFTLSAADTSGAFGQTTGVLGGGGQTAELDVVLTARADEGGRLVGRVFLSDGATPGAGFTVFVGSYDRDNGRLEAIDRTTSDANGTFAFERALPQAGYDVIAFDAGTQQLGVVHASIQAQLTTSVSIVLEATGMVEGVVFNASGAPQAGALVAGGVALVQTDANGFFRLDGVPAGRRRIEAGDPVTRRRGSAEIVVLPGQTVSAAIRLEARATITGRVLDANGTPVPRATVRIPTVGGFTFVFANNSGVFRFPDMTLGDYLIQAPGPSRESLIEFMEANGYDPASAFTAGDIPDGLGASTPTAGDRNAVLAAYQEAVRTFLNVDESLLVGLPMADFGGFGWNRVRLFQDSTTAVADIHFLAQGTVAGRTADFDGRSIGALTRITGLSVSRTGFPTVAELGRVTTDAATGAFAFTRIPRFDLATFQAAGVRGGDFTIEAAHPFSPAIARFSGQLNTTTPNLADVVVQFPAATETNGTIRGQVLLPGGAGAPAGTQVSISFGDLTLTTDASGRFDSALPIPAGSYAITAQAPSGLRGQSRALVPAGGSVDVVVQLLGLGNTTVIVRRPTGQAVAGAAVVLERGSFPGERFNGTTDAAGQIRFVNVSEGPFSVTAEEAITGLRGRASATIVRDADIATPVVITASGRVTGRFLTADGATAIAFAQVVLSTGGVNAFTTTDAAGRFELSAIPVGRFTVEALDPNSGRLGRTGDELLFEGHTVDVTVLQLPRGAVTGLVLQADGTTVVPGATVTIKSSGVIHTELQASTRPDGSFRFDGIPAGDFTLSAREPLGGFQGNASGRLTFESEVVERTITLAPFGSLRVTLRDVGGQPASNATVTISQGERFSRTAAVDVNGQFTFEFLSLGTYQVVGRSLSSSGNGGQATAEVTTDDATNEVTVTFRGAGSVAVTVVAADGVTVVPSAQVRLRANAAAPGDSPGALATELNGFTNASGVVTFQNVPVGTFFATGEAGTVGGVSNGVLAAPGETAATTIRLGPSGSIAGRVLLPDGSTPAAQAIVTLRFPPQSSLQTGVLQVTTNLTGTFEFTGIPVGSFTLDALEIVSSGVRTFAGSLGSNGQRFDIGDLVLDNTGPRVVSIDPIDGSTGVALQPGIAVTFSEPMRVTTFTVTSGNVVLRDGTTPVQLQSPTLSNGNRTVTLRTSSPLRSGGLYTLTIRGGQDGPRDEAADLPMVDAFVSRFTTADTVPPVVVSLSPASAERQVSLDASVRISFSEAVATGTLVVRDAAGAIVTGQTAFAAGNTVLAFAPLGFLSANATYTATLTGVTDTAGNALGGTVSFAFTTIDTLAPAITALQVGGTVRAGGQITITPTVTGTDVQRVDYLIGNTSSATSSTAPFAATATVPAGTQTLTLIATAFDQVGNRSTAFTSQVAVQANAPPTVVLRTVLPLTQIGQGQSVEFEAVASDDDRVSRVALSVVGAASFSEVRQAPGTAVPFTTRFTVQVPAGAPSGAQLTAQAVAIDAAEAQSTPATVTLPIVDGVPPSVTVLSPINNAVILPGQPLTVVVDVTDDVGVSSVALVCAPTFAGCESRVLQPAATTTRQSFVVDIPATFQSTTGITLLVTAADQAGNTIQLGRSVVVPDTVPPTLASLDPVSGSVQVIAGQTVTLRATVGDNVGVTSIVFQTEGGLVTSGTAAVAPPVTSGAATFAIAIPASTANGSTVTVRARARDNGGNLSDERTIVLTVGDAAPPVTTILAPAAGAQTAPGQTVTFTVRATDDTAVQRIVFTASGVVTASETRQVVPPVASVDASFSVPVPAGTAAGTLTLSAEAFDAAGNSGGLVTRAITITDAIAPAVRIVSPAAGAQIDPRTPLTITVEATDAVGVNQITFSATGAATMSETQTINPPASTRIETFSITFAAPLPTGGTLNLNASARDAASNTGMATGVTIQVRDVVAPAVASIVPADAATGVDPATAVTVTFSEPMNRATLTPAAIRLTAGATAVPVTLAISADDRMVTLTPTAALAVNTQFTATVDASIADPAGNPIATAFASTFRTSSPDATAPRVESVNPADNATGVGTTVPVAVTFTEAIDPASVTSASFRALTGSVPVAGTITFENGNRVARFTPTAGWPFEAVVVVELTGAIADTAGNALVTAAGQPVTSPITFTFLTGNFAITSPAASDVIERTAVTLTAQASAALDVASVVFSVNGTALPAVTAAPFSTTYNVPDSVSVPALTIVASARNALNTEIARAEKVVTVSGGLTAAPTVLGLARGTTRTVRFAIAQPAAADLAITLTVVNPAVATASTAQATIAAGERHVDVPVSACTICPWDAVPAGRAVGNTAIVATSARGPAVTIVSVSDPVPGQDRSALAEPVGMAVSQAPAVGHVFSAPSQTSTTTVRVLSAPHPGPTPLDVTITSSNPAVATATAAPLQPGEQTITLTITALQAGVTVLTIRVGTEVRTLTVVVGAASPGLASVIASQPIGIAISAAPSAGQIVSSVGRTSAITLQVLATPHAGPASLPVSVTSSNAAIATAVASAVEPGSQLTTLTITTLAEGFVTFTLRAGTSTRSVGVYVGTPPPSQIPVTFAPPVGVSVVGLPFIGKAFAPSATSTAIGILLLPSAAATPTVVTITSSDPAIASLASPMATVSAGSRMLSLAITTGAAGTATLTLEFNGVRREFQVVVGTSPTAANAPIVIASPVGVSLAPLPGMGRVNVAPGAAVGATIGIQLLPAARGTSTPVTITSNNPSVVSIGGSASLTTNVPAGSLTVPVPLLTSGTTGVAVLRFEFEGGIQDLLVVVGNLSPAEIPALTAPVIGIRINP